MMSEDLLSKHITPKGKLVIGDDVFYLKPLKYKHLPKFWRILKKLATVDEKKLKGEVDNKEIFDILGEDVIETILELEIETMKVSYPDVDINVIEGFVSSNMFAIFPVMMELNSPKQNEATLNIKHKGKDRKTTEQAKD